MTASNDYCQQSGSLQAVAQKCMGDSTCSGFTYMPSRELSPTCHPRCNGAPRLDHYTRFPVMTRCVKQHRSCPERLLNMCCDWAGSQLLKVLTAIPIMVSLDQACSCKKAQKRLPSLCWCAESMGWLKGGSRVSLAAVQSLTFATPNPDAVLYTRTSS